MRGGHGGRRRRPMIRLWAAWLALRGGLWFVPTLLVAGSVAAALVLIELQPMLERDLSEDWPRLFGAGAEGARGMLSAIATSMITVAGVVFSVTIVALSLAASQYSPRVLRSFMSDRPTQFVLGAFVAVFAYCLIVLRTIRGADEGAFRAVDGGARRGLHGLRRHRAADLLRAPRRDGHPGQLDRRARRRRDPARDRPAVPGLRRRARGARRGGPGDGAADRRLDPGRRPVHRLPGRGGRRAAARPGRVRRHGAARAPARRRLRRRRHGAGRGGAGLGAPGARRLVQHAALLLHRAGRARRPPGRRLGAAAAGRHRAAGAVAGDSRPVDGGELRGPHRRAAATPDGPHDAGPAAPARRPAAPGRRRAGLRRTGEDRAGVDHPPRRQPRDGACAPGRRGRRRRRRHRRPAAPGGAGAAARRPSGAPGDGGSGRRGPGRAGTARRRAARATAAAGRRRRGVGHLTRPALRGRPCGDRPARPAGGPGRPGLGQLLLGAPPGARGSPRPHSCVARCAPHAFIPHDHACGLGVFGVGRPKMGLTEVRTRGRRAPRCAPSRLPVRHALGNRSP
ncbi:MAG: DUF2254 domain-containing protein [Comamonadaceae bacterium]|nr:DUF2254 domain-containing protein [Comamonadaceae bacterium]